jgi:hypothetical protein
LYSPFHLSQTQKHNTEFINVDRVHVKDQEKVLENITKKVMDEQDKFNNFYSELFIERV